MMLLTKELRSKLLANGHPGQREKDHIPVVKLFMPGTACTWLLTHLDPECPNIAFGLCDLGLGFPELGNVDLDEIAAVKNRFGLGIERDRYFIASHRLSVYAKAAYDNRVIIESLTVLNRYGVSVSGEKSS